ncbi:MAG: tyrosine--tRNA ligase [Actinobacteria bacterium]|nr:tyrosine--tRNA ligase [Actinomycetota bacterium]
MPAVDLERLVRRAEHVVREEDLKARLEEKGSLRVKLGLDPTAPSVTLGWAVPLRKLREFQDLGHTAVLIVGDFTARIGDPTGKSDTRRRLTKEEVDGHAEKCLDQLMDVLSPDNLEVRYNSEWLEGMDLGGVLELTSKYTVAQMLERKDFATRYSEHRPISMVEFMYPLMQGYDSVAVEADVELGGTDQLFNLLVGRVLQEAYGQPPQIAMTMPLLEGLDGVQKMSQSLGNYIGVREDPAEIFGKVMSIPDALVARYASLAANIDGQELDHLDAAARAGGPEAGRAKRAVARAVVRLYHGDEAATAAEVAFDKQFKKHEVPEDIPIGDLPPAAIEGGEVYLPVVLEALGLASSRSEARRLISQGGVRINGTPVSSEKVSLAELSGAVLQVGKRRYVKIR